MADACVSNTMLLEGVCGSSVNDYGFARILYVDCSAPNSSFGCVAGRCAFMGTNGTNNTQGNTTLLIDLIISIILKTLINTTTINGTNGINGTIGYAFNVAYSILNNGTGNAGPSFTAVKFDAYGPFLLNTPAINAGQTVSVTLPSMYFSLGTYFASALADNTTIISESNEMNNGGFAVVTLP